MSVSNRIIGSVVRGADETTDVPQLPDIEKLQYGLTGSRNGLNSRSSSATYPAIVPSEKVKLQTQKFHWFAFLDDEWPTTAIRIRK
jgi:hypothetical protein